MLALVGVSVLAFAVVAWNGRATGWGYDFGAYYAAIQRLSQTGTPYDPITLAGPFRAGPYGLYLYSPVPLIALLPLGDLDYGLALWVWVAVRLAALALTCALMPVSRKLRLAILGIACISEPVLFDLDLANVSVIVSFLAVLAWRWLDRPVGSVAVAVATSIRPTMGLFVIWSLLRGKWRFALWVVAAGIVLFAASIPFVGLRGWIDYITVLRNLTDFDGVNRNFAIGALLYRLGAPEFLATLGSVVTLGVALIAIGLGLRRDKEVGFMVVLGATIVASPLLWDHYLTNILLPAAFLTARGRWWGLAMPMLCWLPQEALPFTAILAMVAPLAADPRSDLAGTPHGDPAIGIGPTATTAATGGAQIIKGQVTS